MPSHARRYRNLVFAPWSAPSNWAAASFTLESPPPVPRRHPRSPRQMSPLTSLNTPNLLSRRKLIVRVKPIRKARKMENLRLSRIDVVVKTEYRLFANNPCCTVVRILHHHAAAARLFPCRSACFCKQTACPANFMLDELPRIPPVVLDTPVRLAPPR